MRYGARRQKKSEPGAENIDLEIALDQDENIRQGKPIAIAITI